MYWFRKIFKASDFLNLVIVQHVVLNNINRTIASNKWTYKIRINKI